MSRRPKSHRFYSPAGLAPAGQARARFKPDDALLNKPNGFAQRAVVSRGRPTGDAALRRSTIVACRSALLIDPHLIRRAVFAYGKCFRAIRLIGCYLGVKLAG
jgi:hypothetical protein